MVIRSGGWRRVDLGSRALERALLEELLAAHVIDGTGHGRSKGSVARALAAMVRARGLIEGETSPGDCGAFALWQTSRENVFVASATDRGLDERLRRCDREGVPALVHYVTDAVVVRVSHLPGVRPCARCALLLDQSLHALAPPRSLLGALTVAIASGHHVDGGPFGLARAIAERCTHDAWPRPGNAVVFTAHDDRRELTVPAHPACTCAPATRPRSAATSFGWAQTKARMTPLATDARDARGVHQVLFRRSRDPWPLCRDDWGSATASGPGAELRALGEGIERFCMLHAPAERMGTASDLGVDALDEAAIRGLLFRPEERATPGFRLPPYASDVVRGWTRVTHWGNGTVRFVPTSLVGRAPRGDAPLVPATSNGYAAHTEEREADLRAVLEVIERDALLCAWVLGCDAPRIDTSQLEKPAAVRRWGVFLATQDIAVPVVWVLAEGHDGAMRSAAGAAVGFDDALEHALAELYAALVKAPKRADSDYVWEDATRRHLPTDHLRHYLDPRNAAPIRARLDVPCTVHLDTLRTRWPGREQTEQTAVLRTAIEHAKLDVWLADRGLPEIFGTGWHVVRALIPGALELSWGRAYRRLAGHRAQRLLAQDHKPSPWPHPIA